MNHASINVHKNICHLQCLRQFENGNLLLSQKIIEKESSMQWWGHKNTRKNNGKKNNYTQTVKGGGHFRLWLSFFFSLVKRNFTYVHILLFLNIHLLVFRIYNFNKYTHE